ncbi:T9SS type A sorting domain-containing protein, partial [bacterium AH-315-M05]|nr:T9SS type A sorting domain-containing protein [bacterium AH-315-M05]
NTYWVDVTASGCATVRDSIDVTVNVEATVNLGNDTTVCDSILLDAENAGADYLWSTGETTQTIYASSTGTYWVNVTAVPCDSVRDSIVVTVNGPSPTVNLGNDTTVCDSVQLDAGNCCSASYLWSTSEITQTIYASSTGTYWVDVTENSCTTRDSIDVTVNVEATVNLGNDTTVCDSILLDAENTGADYLWSTGETTQTIYASSTGTYWVNVTAVPCDSVRDSIVVTVNPGPVVDLGNDTTVCDSVQLDAGNAGATYLWSTGETTQTIYASLSGLNTYWVDVTEIPCPAVRDSIDVTVHPVPTSSITGDTSVYESTTHIYSVTLTPGYTYTWTLNPPSLGTIDAGQGSNSITVTWNTAGTDTVRCVADSCGSAAPVDLRVTINAVITSTASDFWDLGTTWTGGVVPTASDSAVIVAGNAVTVRTSNAACASVSLNAVGFSTAVITVESGQTLTINGNADLNGSNDVPAVIDLKGTAILNITGNINMNVSTADKARIIMTDGASTLNLNGNINLSSVGTLSSSATSTVNINGSSAQTLAMGSGLVYNHININNSSDTVTLGAAITNANVTGNIKVLTGTFDNGGFSIATVSSDTFQVNNAATFILSGTSGWPSGFTDILGSTIVYAGGNQTVTMPSNGQVYSTLVIAGTGTKTLGENITVSTELRINPSGTTLDASASNFNINLAGNWVNNGTFTARNGAVIFNGSSAQTIGGSTVTSFNNLTINNSSGGVSLTSAQNVTGTLTLTSGVFSTTGGQPFTLISTSSGTARIAEVTGGSLSGNFTMQRYVDGNDGWRFLTPPVSGTTLADWNSEFAMSGFPGVPTTTPPFTSVWTYDETVPFVRDSGYVAPSDISDGLVNGRGYFAWIGDAPGAPITKTIDLTGSLTSGQNLGTKVITVTYTNNLDSDNDGWNLIGNTYPSDVSWDAVSLSNVTGFAYIYSDASSGYEIYEQGVGSKTIASHQAFWVKVPTDAAASVTFDEADKATESDPFLKVVNPNSIKLTLTGNGFTDETEVRFKQGATEDYDWQYDAYKLLSFNYLTPSLSSVSADSTDLSINSLPELTQDIDIPIRITWSWPSYNFGNTATYTITVNDLSDMPLSTCIVLEDLLTSTSVNLRIDSSYTFTISDTTTVPRFLLHLGAPISKEGIDVSCNGASDGMAIASGQGSAPWNYTWTNSSGDTIQTSTNINSPDTLYGLLPDTYTVYITSSNALCSNVYDIIIIDEPAILSANATPTNVSCNGGNDGSAMLTTIGGTLPYTYLWNDDSLQTTATATGLPTGNYSVTITDNNGCVQTANATIGEATAITTNIDQTDVSCNGGNDGSATLTTIGGTPPYTYLWNDDSLQTTPMAMGLPAGNYSVTITDNNGCVQTANTTINEPAVVIADFFISADTVFLSEGGIVQFTNNSSGASSYQWDFGDGVSSFDQSPWHKYDSTGNYTITLIALNSNMCYDSINFQITVLDNPVRVIDPDFMESTIRLLQNAEGVFIEFNLRELTEVNISIYNLLGQKAIKDHKIKVQNDRIKVRLPNDVPGVYFIKIETGVQSITEKIILP